MDNEHARTATTPDREDPLMTGAKFNIDGATLAGSAAQPGPAQ